MQITGEGVTRCEPIADGACITRATQFFIYAIKSCVDLPNANSRYDPMNTAQAAATP